MHEIGQAKNLEAHYRERNIPRYSGAQMSLGKIMKIRAECV